MLLLVCSLLVLRLLCCRLGNVIRFGVSIPSGYSCCYVRLVMTCSGMPHTSFSGVDHTLWWLRTCVPCLAYVLCSRCVHWLYYDKACFARLLPLLPRLPWCVPLSCLWFTWLSGWRGGGRYAIIEGVWVRSPHCSVIVWRVRCLGLTL